MSQKPLIGFIGQGFVGKNYADDFERRGYTTVRYALEEPYAENKERIKDADIVFVCVPTPTTPDGFDASIVEEGVSLAGKGKTAVIKSTLLPGTTSAVQKKFPDRIVLCSPEFLSVATAAHDAANPFSNIIGMPQDSAEHRDAAEAVKAALAPAPFSLICKSEEAEMIKYAHNTNGYVQVILANLLYDAAQKLGCDWSKIQQAIEADPLISNRYSNPIHKSGRGAGGFCFIKDMAAFSALYKRLMPDDALGKKVLSAMECKNIDLLRKSGKDLPLLKGVYGDDPEAVCGS